jgi:hypothetical protein
MRVCRSFSRGADDLSRLFDLLWNGRSGCYGRVKFSRYRSAVAAFVRRRNTFYDVYCS